VPGPSAQLRSYISRASPARSVRSAPAAAALVKMASASLRRSAGRRSSQAQNACAHDREMSPAANARAITGWAASRFIQATVPAAAPEVTLVCHFSQTRAEP